VRLQQRRRGLWPSMGGGLLSPLVPSSGGLRPNNPFLDDELSRVLNELQSMQDMVFGHRDTVGRIPEKLDFNCDILEKKGEFLITADLPGLSKDMVSITVDDGRRLHITAERAARHEEEIDEPEEDVKLHVYERVYGKIERLFRLPDNANAEKIAATMKNGVLTVHVPKHPQAEEEAKKELHERQIKIK
jgi:HSP20 family molecular chaperone IbpA